MVNWLILHCCLWLMPGKTDTLPQYTVNSLEGRQIDFKRPGHKGWDHCREIKPLHAPWEQRKEGDTRFRAGYDSRYFYFRFLVKDKLLVTVDNSTEIAVAKGDRVEMFFAADTTLREYFCLELSPYGKVLDYKAAFYRKFDDTWNLEGLEVAAAPHAKGYYVSGRIPLRFFKTLAGREGDMKGASVYAGVFRAEKNSEQATAGFTWFSWVMPKAADPDFHIPSAFGIFRF